MAGCGKYFQTYVVVFAIFSGLLLASTIPVFCKYLSAKSKSAKKKGKLLWVVGLIFMIFNILSIAAIFSLSVKISIKCTADTNEKVIGEIWMFTYFVQTYLLSLMSFLRLQTVFMNTPYELSKCTVITYKIIYIVLPLMEITVKVFNGTVIAGVIIAAELLVLIASFISIIILFMRKLLAVYKCVDSDLVFISTITKLALLSSVSISISISVPVIMIVILSITPSHAVGSTAFMISNLFDIYTNFWCIMFSYKHFKNYYQVACGCVDTRCRKLWFRCVGRDEIVLKMLHIDSSTQKSNSSVKSSSPSAATTTMGTDTTTKGIDTITTDIDTVTVTVDSSVKQQ